MSKTYVVYLPTGTVFVTADGYIKFEETDKEVVFFIRDEFTTVPIAQFNRNNIYGWSEYHG